MASQKSIPTLYERAQDLRVFEFDELRNSTKNFSGMNKIGEGGFRRVYKGYIRPPDGEGGKKLVAIKKLNQRGFQIWLEEDSCLKHDKVKLSGREHLRDEDDGALGLVDAAAVVEDESKAHDAGGADLSVTARPVGDPLEGIGAHRTAIMGFYDGSTTELIRRNTVNMPSQN
ncbi:hypothetical protein Cni_G19392 [Canna indica]|uniref:Uncharacterized protein n=1 Tax=Canna indica TaxID=4628 RepID=A0AAQ3QIK9_9LILI|nr:hypothetical protein Cni_G19392 [Canna indica]